MSLQRSHWLGLLARSQDKTLADALEGLDLDPELAYASAVWIRPVETGLMQVMARADGVGAPFCFQEVTSTRASIRLSNGQTGHALVLGHRIEHCKRVAWLDAAMKDENFRVGSGAQLLQVLQIAEQSLREQRRADAEQTRVEFFTLAREAGG